MNWQDKIYSSLAETRASKKTQKAAKKKAKDPASIHPSKRTPAEQKEYEKRRKAMQAHMKDPYGTKNK